MSRVRFTSPSWLALFGASVVAACGGRAVLEDDLGVGGAGASATTGVGDPLCVTPSPVGDLFECGTTGAGAPGECSTSDCDAEGTSWAQTCTAESCVCTFNGATKCICVANQPGGDFCGGTPKCCPAPWR
jgi:hypothetical protein